MNFCSLPFVLLLFSSLENYDHLGGIDVNETRMCQESRQGCCAFRLFTTNSCADILIASFINSITIRTVEI